MKQSVEPPPPPPDFPPPPQTRSSHRSRSGRSWNTQQTTSETTQQEQEQQQQQTPQQQYENEISASARTVTHSNNTATQISSTDQTNAMHAMEMDGALPYGDTKHSRFPRKPWAKPHLFDPHGDGIMSSLSYGDSSVEGLYYGDVMSSFPLEEEDEVIPPNFSTESTAGSHASRFQRLRRIVTASLRSSSFMKSPQKDSTEDDDDSLNDFHDWTPPDSAYGAAFPICGWVPKHYRRLIEATIFALVVFTLVIFVVTTSIRLTLDKDSSVSSSSGTNSTGSNQNNKNKFSDDDYYIDYDNYHKNNAADDEFAAFDDDAVVANDDAVQAGDDGNEDYQNADQQEQAGDDQDAGGDRMFLRLF